MSIPPPDAPARPATAAIYVRQSRDFTGEQLGVTRQREDCEELAARRDWQIAAVHVDNDVSAAGKKRRPAFEALMASIETGGITTVVAWNWDRLTRNPRDKLRILEAGKECRLMIALARGSDLDLATPSGRFAAGVLGEAAQYEIDSKSDRQVRAAVQRSELGRPPLGVRLTGYTSSGELVEDEAAMVHVIFDRFGRGDSLRALARALEVGGYSTRHGGPWNSSTVRGILTNPRYAGRAVYQGNVTGGRGNWEPLVNEEVFDAIKVKLADPRRRMQQGTDRKHLGSGLYLCGVCDQPVSSWSGQRYRCKNACSNRSRPKIDEAVEIQIRRRLSRPDLADLLPPEENVEAQRLSGEMTRLRTRLLTVEGDYDAGDIDGRRYAVATEKINAELAAVQAAFAAASRGQEAAALRGGDPLGAYDSGSLMMKQGIIRALCVVRLYPAPRGRKTFDPDSIKVEWLAADD